MHGPFTKEPPQLLAVPVLCSPLCLCEIHPAFWREAQTMTLCRKLITEDTFLTGWFHEEWESQESGGVILQQWGQLCRPLSWCK